MNQNFKFNKTFIEGVIEIEPFSIDDHRGNFTKDYSKDIFQKNSISHDIKEIFYATSCKGVIRGLHFQRERQQAKLVRCISGHIFDVVVDLRKDSVTFKKWIGFNLTEKKKNQLLIPAGCAHGYLVLENATVSYKCSEIFYPEYDDGIIWNDSDINISWPLEKIGGYEAVVLSDKDKNLQTFQNFSQKYRGF